MVGFLIVSHGSLAEGLKDSISMIMGEQEQFEAVGLRGDTDMEHFADEIYKAAVRVDDGDGIVLFTDMFGASPCNFAAMNMGRFLEEKRNVKILTGVNLPMVLEGFIRRMECSDPEKIKEACLDGGREGVQDFTAHCMDMDEDDEE